MVLGVITNSNGRTPVIMRGMPVETQVMRMSSPCPPAAWSARLASKIFWYSGVSGACCARPGGLVWSHWLPMRGGFFHWPDQSGYLVSSNACAVAPMIKSAMAPTAIRSNMLSSLEQHAPNLAKRAAGVQGCARPQAVTNSRGLRAVYRFPDAVQHGARLRTELVRR